MWTVILVLILLWALGLIGGQSFGGLLHLLLLVALICLVVQLLTGRRPPLE